MKPTPIQVVLVDDHPLLREGTRGLLKEEPDMEVVGVAGDAATALRMVRELCPDVLVLDLRLPDASGVEVAKRVQGECPRTAVLILTGYEDVSYEQALRRLGVGGYLRKTASGNEIVSAIRAVAAGRAVFGPESCDAVGDPSAPRPDLLTERELEVLRLLSAGRRNAEVAQELVVSIKTVEFHVGNLLDKLGARSRTEALAVARRAGILPE